MPDWIRRAKRMPRSRSAVITAELRSRSVSHEVPLSAGELDHLKAEVALFGFDGWQHSGR